LLAFVWLERPDQDIQQTVHARGIRSHWGSSALRVTVGHFGNRLDGAK
jgi:hypothetical protein